MKSDGPQVWAADSMATAWTAAESTTTGSGLSGNNPNKAPNTSVFISQDVRSKTDEPSQLNLSETQNNENKLEVKEDSSTLCYVNSAFCSYGLLLWSGCTWGLFKSIGRLKGTGSGRWPHQA